MITGQKLAKMLAVFLNEDNWGDIDPYWIERVGEVEHEDLESQHFNEVEALRKIFERLAVDVNAMAARGELQHDLWLEYLVCGADGVERCGLCLNTGLVTVAYAKPCICPNGRARKRPETNL